MSNYIKVDHSRFENVAKAIDNYINKHKSNMTKANQEITTLSSTWQGQDFMQFQAQWNRITDNGSTSQKMTKAMENYAQFLRFAANKYKEAQAKAVNRANGIPRW